MASPVAIPAGFEIESSPPAQPAAKGSGGIPEGFRVEQDFGIDWSRPINEVRADVAKLPAADRQEALDQWADAFVARERQARSALSKAGDAARLAARGTFLGSWLDEANAATAGVLNRLTGGLAGAPYDEAVAYQRALDRAIDREWGGYGTALQVAGGLASAGGGLALAGPAIKAASTGGRIAGGALAGGIGAGVYGAGAAEGGPEERIRAGLKTAPVGAAIGAAAPPVISAIGAAARPVADALSPTIARWGANARGVVERVRNTNLDAARQSPGSGLPFRQEIPMAPVDDAGGGFVRHVDDIGDGGAGVPPSAPAGMPPATPGAIAAAEQVAANQLLRGGLRPEQVRNAFGNPDDTMRFHSNSYAQDARMPVDLNPSLQRLASSAARNNPEAGTIAEAVLRARQTGLTPDSEIDRAIVAEAGLPTRAAMARAGEGGANIVGQFERTRDALRRALTIEDEQFHRHMRSGRRTEQAVVDEARREAETLYSNAYRAGANADFQSAFAPVFRYWTAQLPEQAEPIQKMLSRLMESFGRTRNLAQFDRNKRYLLDAKIESLMNSPVGRNPETARVLTLFKNDLLRGVEENGVRVGGADNIPGAGALYHEARNAFESQMALRDALRAGRDAFREQSEVGVDAYRALATEGERKMFRLGLLDSFTDRAASMKSGANKLQLFDNPRIQEILAYVIPRTETRTGRAKANAVFADRPQRFGRWLESEGRMVQTRNEVTGNSKTAQRLADDEAYRSLNTISEVFQATASPTQAMLKAADKAFQSVFGLRADTAAALSRMLFTADPVRRQQVIENIVRRMGASRAQALADYLARNQAALVSAAGRGAAAAGIGQERR